MHSYLLNSGHFVVECLAVKRGEEEPMNVVVEGSQTVGMGTEGVTVYGDVSDCTFSVYIKFVADSSN